ncbi:hypothetical protein ABGT15_11870 [Flavobacterium enshiense]|uniref:hypothetical protein n=1 Tax=Flavobacterium enshiense TaxID=1341165 RepID=UPI00345D9FA0
MKKLVFITLLLYYTVGTFILPMGNFSILPKLPSMYAHCKATEDCDMDALDFITDHLLNFDGIFDTHEEGDDQKPHRPIQTQNTIIQLFITTNYSFSISKNPIIRKQKNRIQCTAKNIFNSDFTARKFRPPIVC